MKDKRTALIMGMGKVRFQLNRTIAAAKHAWDRGDLESWNTFMAIGEEQQDTITALRDKVFATYNKEEK